MRHIAAALTPLTLALLAACANPTALPADTVAQVGNTTITTQYLNSLTNELTARNHTENSTNSEADTRNILTHLITIEIVRTTAENNNVTLAPQQLASQWLTDTTSPPTPAPQDISKTSSHLPHSLSITQTEIQLLLQELENLAGQTPQTLAHQLTETSRNLSVILNPQYGTWNHETMQINPPEN